MTKQALLEKIERRIKIEKKPISRVSLSLEDWQLIKDIILELASPILLKSVEKARGDYKKGKGIEYHPKRV